MHRCDNHIFIEKALGMFLDQSIIQINSFLISPCYGYLPGANLDQVHLNGYKQCIFSWRNNKTYPKIITKYFNNSGEEVVM